MALIVDAVMCGHLANGEEALMALGFAGQILFLMVVVMMGITVGAVALVARAHGARVRERVQHLFQQSLQLTLILGVVAGALGVASSRPLLRMLGADAAVEDAAFGYLAPLMGATVFAYLNILLGAVLRGVGNTRLALLVAVVVNGLNVLLNGVLIFGLGPVPSFGLAGAAYGTILAQIVGVLLTGYMLRRDVEPALELRLRWAPLDLPLTREILRVGAPAALDMMIMNSALFVIIALLGRAEPLAVAAHGIGMRLQSLAFVPGLSIAQATGAMVGQSLGGGDVGRVREVLRASSKLAAGVLSVLGVLIVVFADPLIALFGAQPGSPLGEHLDMDAAVGAGDALGGGALRVRGALSGLRGHQHRAHHQRADGVLLSGPPVAAAGSRAGLRPPRHLDRLPRELRAQAAARGGGLSPRGVDQSGRARVVSPAARGR